MYNSVYHIIFVTNYEYEPLYNTRIIYIANIQNQ